MKAPEGGPKDTVGPTLLGVDPPAGTRQFTEQRITFTFDEYLATSLQQKDVFLSPRPAERLDAYTTNRKLVVKLPSGLLPNQTYVLTLGTGIKDYNQGNSLTKAIQYPFSTGEVLDSLEVSGQVIDVLSGKPQEGYVVGLFRADSLQANGGFTKLSPTNVALSDKQGVFQLSYLAPGEYLLLGFQDADGTYTWTGIEEPVALDDLDTLALKPGSPRQLRNLYTAVLDTTPPLLISYREENATNFRFDFTEPLSRGQVTYQDSTWSWSDQQAFPPFRKDSASTLLLRLIPPTYTDSFDIRLQIADTLGIETDTLVRLATPRTDLVDYLLLEMAPEQSNPYALRFYLSDWVKEDTLARYVSLRDSSDSLVHARLESSQHLLTVHLDPAALQLGMPYRLLFDSLLTSTSGYRLENPKIYAVVVPDERRLSVLSGTIETDRAILVQLLLDGELVRSSVGSAFNFRYLEPGEYQLRVIEDVDGNGRWTPGALFPVKRLSEPVIVYPDKITLRGGWENELHLPYPPR